MGYHWVKFFAMTSLTPKDSSAQLETHLPLKEISPALQHKDAT